MQRTLILIIAGIIVAISVIVGGVVLWRIVTRPGGVFGPAAQPSPTAAEDLTRTLSAGNAISPSVDSSGRRIRYFDAKERKLKDTDFAGTLASALSDHEFQNVFRVTWAPTSTLAILEYEDEFSNRQLSLVDVATGTTTPLHQNIRALAWSPDGSQIAYQWRNDVTGENAIFLSSPDTSNRRALMPLQLLAVDLFWLDARTILIVEKPTPGIQSLVLVYDLETARPHVILQNRYGVSVRPSPDGKKLLFSSTTDAEGNVLLTEIYGIDGTLLATLPFVTLAEKCTWGSDSETLFCAVPETFGAVSGMPFVYWTGTLATRDAFAAYKFTNGDLRELAPTLPDVDAIDLVIPQAENAIAFVNRLDGRLSVVQP